jgi:ribose-phosphate pyrophosphokinase
MEITMLVLLGNSIAHTLSGYFNDRALNDKTVEILPASIGKFVSSEAFTEIKNSSQNLKGIPVTVVHSLAAFGDHTANDLAMQLLFIVQTLKRNGAGPVWVVAPFLAYGRQDKAIQERMTSIAIDDFSSLLKHAGAEGISTIEMHSKAGVDFLIKNFGEDQVFNLNPTELFVTDVVKNLKNESFVVGGPDAGANERADSVAQHLNALRFSFKKQHTGINETEVTDFSGDVTGKTTLTIDDMIDTGGTIENAQVKLESQGAKSRYVYAAHGIFSKGGLERLFKAKTASGNDYAITQLIVTDTIDINIKLAKLQRKYGHEQVKQRVRTISTGEMLYKHIVRDIAKHPKMTFSKP